MSNSDDLQSFKREVYTDVASNVRAQETLYQNGSISSQLIEEEHLFAHRFRDIRVGSGSLIGVILVTFLGIGVLLWYLSSQSDNKPIQQVTFPSNEAPRSP